MPQKAKMGALEEHHLYLSKRLINHLRKGKGGAEALLDTATTSMDEMVRTDKTFWQRSAKVIF